MESPREERKNKEQEQKEERKKMKLEMKEKKVKARKEALSETGAEKTDVSTVTNTSSFAARLMLGVATALRSEVNRKVPLNAFDYGRYVTHHIKASTGSDRVKIDEYSPAVFAHIRELGNVTAEELLAEWELDESQLAKEDSVGKSGSYFLFSKNKQFFLKSIEKQEKTTFRKMTQDYYQHLVAHPKSTFMRIYGFFRMRGGVRNVSFIMFGNCLLSGEVKINEKYDLKGSLKDRNASKDELRKAVPNYMDNDLTKKGRKFNFTETAKNEFIAQIKADSKLLANHEVMDYSLLIGIHPLESGTPLQEAIVKAFNCESGLMRSPYSSNVYQLLSADLKELYFISIIDCLTPYDWRKVVAHNAKKTAWSSEELSTVNATFYQTRFVEFMDSIIVTQSAESKKEVVANSNVI